MQVIRIDAGRADRPPGRRRLLLTGILGVGLPVLILPGVGAGLYQTFFRTPELRALLFDGGRMARGAVLPLADGAVVLSQENAQHGAVALLQVLDRPNRLAYEALDRRTGRSLRHVAAEVEAATWEGVAWSDEAAWLTIAAPYRVDLRGGVIARPWSVAEPVQLPEHRR